MDKFSCDCEHDQVKLPFCIKLLLFFTTIAVLRPCNLYFIHGGQKPSSKKNTFSFSAVVIFMPLIKYSLLFPFFADVNLSSRIYSAFSWAYKFSTLTDEKTVPGVWSLLFYS